MTNDEGKPVDISVTIGVAVWPDVGEDTIHGMLRAADAALYEGKRNGRDRVQVAGGSRRHPGRNVTGTRH